MRKTNATNGEVAFANARYAPVDRAEMPPVTGDELVAVAILLDRYVLSAETWMAMIEAARGPYTKARFSEWVRSLLQKGYVQVVSNQHVVELGLPTDIVHYATTESGAVLVMDASLVVELLHADPD